MNHFHIREAQTSDIQAIADLHSSQSRTQIRDSSGGFLLAEITQEQVHEHMKQGTRYFLATLAPEEQAEIVGLVALSQPEITPQILETIRWTGEDYGDRLMSDRHYYIQVLVTKPGWTGKGVAQSLYRFLYKTLPGSVLSGFIVTQPITNHRSLNFHHQQGFSIIGAIDDEEFLNLKSCQRTIIYREI
ncbi:MULTISPECIES: GNAT family N-acetyltransferase [unclassified Roseofilum]|uniref:GNAT family N-acetyltransferase n=1 Tax=unclassified Roseofilum TaxID=2620099 RepID=UPI000E978AEB|nr:MULTISPECIES: GNAT family N-acetyltransferase [unclassified Roseofilum]MBP0008603.1 GNAT family N-acetyltransferase [Roseofilum sp. Belize Diploria]MBP0034545.1 GNAT family N-acetyltransferase [Roseofilum sp. Belize BBD 4]HBQ97339.1 N-acetyltransferase [Cyanobacteria bacterium UBA11691]